MKKQFQLSALTTLLFASQMLAIAANSNGPVITSVGVNYVANTLTISGANLLGATGGGIYSITLATSPADALSVVGKPTTGSVTASLPAASPASSIAPGSYQLAMVFLDQAGNVDPNGSATFDVTLGAVGPVGLQGPQGPQFGSA